LPFVHAEFDPNPPYHHVTNEICKERLTVVMNSKIVAHFQAFIHEYSLRRTLIVSCVTSILTTSHDCSALFVAKLDDPRFHN
jgi:hypothetical protein